MNPVFWFMVIVIAFLLWLAISFVFIPLGRFLAKRMKGILNIINYEETDEEKKESKTE